MKLTQDHINSLRKWFVDKTGDFVFRYVHNVTAHPEHIIDTEIISVMDDGKIEKQQIPGVITADDVHLSPAVFEKTATPHYSRFFGFTKKNKLRATDPCEDGSSIFFNSATCGFFNAPFLDLVPRPGKRHRFPLPRPSHKDKGDLIAGFVVKGEKGWKYTNWFICSEQFFTLWTLIMFPEGHESLCRDKASPDALKQAMLHTNRLVSNPFKRWYDAAEDNGMDLSRSIQECRNRLVALRYEKGAKETYHLYPCLAMLIYWGELPSDDNVPNSTKELPLSKEWKIPQWCAEAPQGWLRELTLKVAHFDWENDVLPE